jgi:hypothetical protein
MSQDKAFKLRFENYLKKVVKKKNEKKKVLKNETIYSYALACFTKFNKVLR